MKHQGFLLGVVLGVALGVVVMIFVGGEQTDQQPDSRSMFGTSASTTTGNEHDKGEVGISPKQGADQREQPRKDSAAANREAAESESTQERKPENNDTIDVRGHLDQPRKDSAFRPADTSIESVAPLADLKPTEREWKQLRETLQAKRAEATVIGKREAAPAALMRAAFAGNAISRDIPRNLPSFRSRIPEVLAETVIEVGDQEGDRVPSVSIRDEITSIQIGKGEYSLNIYPEVKELKIRGASQEETRLRQLTIHSGNLEVLDIAGVTLQGSGALRIMTQVAARVRNVTFTSLHSSGYGASIGVSGSAYIDIAYCTFDGRMRSGVDGHAISLRGGAIAAFEECTFVGFKSLVRCEDPRQGEGSSISFHKCQIENSLLAHINSPERLVDHPMHIDFKDCTISVHPQVIESEERNKLLRAEYTELGSSNTLRPSACPMTPATWAKFMQALPATYGPTHGALMIYQPSSLGPGLFAVRHAGDTYQNRWTRDCRLYNWVPDTRAQFVTFDHERNSRIDSNIHSLRVVSDETSTSLATSLNQMTSLSFLRPIQRISLTKSFGTIGGERKRYLAVEFVPFGERRGEKYHATTGVKLD